MRQVLLSEMATMRKRIVELELKTKQTDEIISRNLMLQEKLEAMNEEWKQNQEKLRQIELMSHERESEAKRKVSSLSEDLKCKENQIQHLHEQLRQHDPAILQLTSSVSRLEEQCMHVFELTSSFYNASKANMSKLEGFQLRQRSLLELNQKMSMERNQILKGLHNLEQENSTLSHNLAVLKMQNKKTSQELEFQKKILQDVEMIKTEIETTYREILWNAQAQGNIRNAYGSILDEVDEAAMKDSLDASLFSSEFGESLPNESFESKSSFNPFTSDGAMSPGTVANPHRIVVSLKQVVKQFLKAAQVREVYCKKNFYSLQESRIKADELAVKLQAAQSLNGIV